MRAAAVTWTTINGSNRPICKDECRKVVNAPNVQPFLPGNRHSCPECCTLTGKYPSKPFWSRLLCTVFVNSSRKLGAYLAQNHHQTTRETSWRLDKRSRSGIFVQSFVLLTTRRDSVFLFYVAREFTTIERRDQLVERVPDWYFTGKMSVFFPEG
jgi:hypothetical protein